MSAQKEKEAAQMTADMIRLAEVRKARAEKEAAARQLAIDKLSKELSGLAVSQFAGAAAKSEKAVGADGVVAAVLQAALDQAGGMPTPDAKSLTKAIKVALPTLKEVVTSEQKQIGVLGGMQVWLLAHPDRLKSVGKGATNMCVLLQDGDVLEENIILKWWAGLTASHDKAVASSTDAKDYFGEAITASSTAIEKEREAAEVSSTKVADEKFYKKQAENAKCGQAATAEEEAWEKEANQAHRKAIKEKEQAISRAAATKKASGVAEQDKLAATKDAEDKEMAAKQLVQLVKALTPFIDWLTAEDSSNED